MDIEIVGNAGVDFFQERQEFLGPVALVALADDEAGGDVERGGSPYGKSPPPGPSSGSNSAWVASVGLPRSVRSMTSAT